MSLPTSHNFGSPFGGVPPYNDQDPVRHGAQIHYVNAALQHIPAFIDEVTGKDARGNPTGEIIVNLPGPPHSTVGPVFYDDSTHASGTWHFPWWENGSPS